MLHISLKLNQNEITKNLSSPQVPAADSSPRSPAAADHNGEEVEEEVEVELPPPMKPISEPILVGGSSSAEDSQGKRVSTF